MQASSLGGRIKTLGIMSVAVAASIPSTLLIPLPLTLAITRRYRREGMLQRLHLMVPWARFCVKRILGIRMSVKGQRNLPADMRGHMIVCNHQSAADIVVLIDALGVVAFLAKSSVMWVPILGLCAYAAGSVFVHRKDRSSRRMALERMLRMCNESRAVVVFPEGTRSEDGDRRAKIYPGAIRAAFERGIRIIPVGLHGTHCVTPKSGDRVNRGERVAVTIGEPMDPSTGQDGREWTTTVWDRVGDLYEESRSRVAQSAA